MTVGTIPALCVSVCPEVMVALVVGIDSRPNTGDKRPENHNVTQSCKRVSQLARQLLVSLAVGDGPLGPRGPGGSWTPALGAVYDLIPAVIRCRQ